MHTNNVTIRKIEKDELSLVRDLPPPEWNIDLEKVYSYHYDQEYFYPVVAVIDSEITGTGIAMINDNATWLGTIIVRENFRKKGLGKAITDHLILYSRSRGINTIILAASEAGLPLYRNIGFVHDINYLFFRTDTPDKTDHNCNCISVITETDYQWIIELDFAISGERREKLLTQFLKTGFKYKYEDSKGYYLPDFGTGLIIADSGISGLELLRFRLSRDPSPICVPETNSTAIDYLNSVSYHQYLRTPRMFMNNNVKWHSENIYSRGCGYLG
jgi:GNAT superfamily N-acetyltransferase